jgi:N-acetylglucosaminyl-diphospho-decaprenol L-rhamnosyltransferase
MAPNATAIIIDNASRDRTLERASAFPNVEIIANSENTGFAAAVNQGLHATKAETALLLNPDVRLLTSIDLLVAASERYGLSAGKLVDQSGQPQEGFTLRRFPTAGTLMMETLGINRLWRSNPINRKYRYLDRDLEVPGPVEQPAGAFLMFQRDVWERLNGFDERFYPVWFEDVDFCQRALKCGYRIEYIPQVEAFHDGGHSVGQLSSGCRALYWCDSLLSYAGKYFSLWEYRGICLTIVLSSVPRLVAGILRDRNLGPASMWLKVVKLAVRRFFLPAGLRVSPKQS